jgi:hypothetical protein
MLRLTPEAIVGAKRLMMRLALARQPGEGFQVWMVVTSCIIGGGPADGSTP